MNHNNFSKSMLFIICGIISIQAAHANTFLVFSELDSGVGSLRQAIVDANENPGLDEINFVFPENICSAEGVCRINLSSNLPEITDELIIDGTSQPQYGSAPKNVCATENNASYMRVEILSDFEIFNIVNQSIVTIKGLSLSGQTIFKTGDKSISWINCNHIGVNAQGNENLDTSFAVCVDCSIPFGSSIVLGTNSDGIDDVSERNLISGSSGVNFNSGTGSIIAGNYFGLSADGLIALPILGQNNCIFSRQSTNMNTIGSNLDGVFDDTERNVFGACGDQAIRMMNFPNTTNLIAGNWIGLNVNGESTGEVEIGLNLESSSIAAQYHVAMNWIEATDTAIQIQQEAKLTEGSINNCFINTPIGLNHMGAQKPIPFTQNFWGDSTGPSGVGAGLGAMLIESSTGTVVFEPWMESFPAGCFMNLDIIFQSSFEE
ncbi:MAG: hypothetical protein AB8B80_07145 [Marinicellaceae bacterium]